MIKIGKGLLPILGDIMTDITKALPKIEKWASAFGKIASPTIKAFFSGLKTVLHELLGPLKNVTLAILGGGGLLFAFSALSAAIASNPVLLAVAGIAAAITIIGKLHGPLKTVALAITGVAAAIALLMTVGAPELVAFGALVLLIVKYHKQIWDVIKSTWDKIAAFFRGLYDKLVRPIVRAFDDIKSFITRSFDGWWKSHGAELEEVWKAVWGAITGYFKMAWNNLITVLHALWDVFGPFLEMGLSNLEATWDAVWAGMQEVFSAVWDVISATVKVVWDGIETYLKIIWDAIVGTFDIFLDLITGHWSKAWQDAQNTSTQIWNAIRDFFSNTWDTISSTASKVWGDITGFLSAAWDRIKSVATGAFDAIRSAIASVWDGIVHDIETAVGKIESIISGISHAITSVPGKILSAVGLASGGVIPGYAPGRDSVPAMLSPGEGVLTPEAVRGLGGPGFVHAANSAFSGSRVRMGSGGIVTSFADGGIASSAGWGAGWNANLGGGDLATAITQLVNVLSGQEQLGAPGSAGREVTVYQEFSGTQWPNREQMAAMVQELTSALSNA
jgi:phage-related protein